MIYDFQCRTCGHEERDKYSIRPLPKIITCPKCGRESFEKKVNKTNFRLKWLEAQGETK